MARVPQKDRKRVGSYLQPLKAWMPSLRWNLDLVETDGAGGYRLNEALAAPVRDRLAEMARMARGATLPLPGGVRESLEFFGVEIPPPANNLNSDETLLDRP